MSTLISSLPKIKWPVLAFVSASVLILLPAGEHLFESILFALKHLILIAPLIGLAMFVTAFLIATSAVNLLSQLFAGNQLKMILLVSMIGALTPVCGVTVLPLVAGLLAASVPLAPIMAFLLSSPITSPEMIAITAATLGWSFAIGKTVAALAIGIFGGVMTLILIRAGLFNSPVRDVTRLQELTGQSGCNLPDGINWRFWQAPKRRAVFKSTLLATFRLALIWLSLAFVAEYYLALYLPAEVLAKYAGASNVWAVPLAATLGAPIYLDGYAALPLIRGLIDKGVSDAAAMTFLIAGGITSAWAAIPVFALLRNAIFIFYIAMAIICSMLSGWMFGFAMM